MTESTAEVERFLAALTPEPRQRDARQLVELMARVTGESPRLWGSGIVGFGQYHYRYRSGREGDAPGASFSPRRAAISVYLTDGIEAHREQLEQLGPHSTGVGCLYLKTLASIDLAVLEAIVGDSYRALTRATYGLRASEAAKSTEQDARRTS